MFTKEKRWLQAGVLAVFLAVLVGCIGAWKDKNTENKGIEMQPQREVLVAILDSGLDTKAETVDTGRMSVDAYDIQTDSKEFTDTYGHGTDIYKLISANTSSSVQLMPVKVADDYGRATIADVYEGVIYAYENGADVINLSMNTTFYSESEELASLIDRLSEEGIYVVVSAGNAGADVANYFPANVDSAIVVGAEEDGERAYFSNYGSTVDYYAYGKYENTLGTSYAAAYVTSMIANQLSYGETDAIKALASYQTDEIKNTENEVEAVCLWDNEFYVGEETDGAENTLYLSGTNHSAYDIGIDILNLAWEDLEQEELDGYLAETDYAYVGLFLSKLSEKERAALEEKTDIFEKNVIVSPLIQNEEGNFISGESEEIPFYQYCINQYDKAKDILSVSEEWTCTGGAEFGNAVFYISSPDRRKIGKYTINGLLGRTGMWKDSNSLRHATYSYTFFPYKDAALSYTGTFTFPQITGISIYAGAARAHRVDYFLPDNTLYETQNYPEFNGRYADGDLYAHLGVQFNNFNVTRLGYHVSENSVVAYNTDFGVGTSTAIAKSRRLEDHAEWNEIIYANFKELVNGYIHIYHDDVYPYEMKAISFPIYKDSFLSGTGMFNLNVSPFWAFGTKWSEDGNLMAESDVPEFVLGMEPNTYTIVYDGNGGTGYTDPQYVPFNDATHNGFFTLKDNPFTFPGCTFNNYAIIRQSDGAVYCGAYGWQSMSNAIGSNPANWFPFAPGSTWIMDANWLNPNPTVLNDTFIVCAQWQVAAGGHLLTVNPNGGTWEGSTSNQSFILNQGATKSIPDPTRDGYTFTGWTLTGSGSTIANKIFTMGNANATLTANWSINRSTLKVNPNGGTWNGSTNEQPFTQDYNTTKDIPVPTRTGYRFTGWTKSSSFNGSITSTTMAATYTFGKANGTTDTLTANWVINTSTLKVNPNGGTWNGSTNTQSFTQNYNTTKDISVPTRTGYRFTGWTKSSSFNGSITSTTAAATYTFGKTHGATDTLTANWVINTSTLKVNPNGGTWNGSTNTQSFTQNYNTTKDIPVPTRTGYRFTGWTKSSTFYGSITSTTAAATYTFGKTHGVTDTLTANWVINTSTLKVNPNGGTWNGSTDTQSFTQNYNTTKDIPVPTRTGYRFTGWTKSSSFNGSITSTTAAATYTFGKTHGATDTLTANWVINTSTLKVNPNGGTWNGSTDTQSFTQNYNTTKDIPVPTLEGYTFIGWKKSDPFNGSMTSLTAAATYTFGPTNGAEDTLTAQWRINNYNVNLIAGTGIESVTGAGTYPYKSTVNISATMLPGYHWINWTGTYNSEDIDYSFRVPAHDVTMTANGEANRYTIRFDGNGATSGSMEPMSCIYDETYTLTPNGFSKDGYHFLKWNTKADGTGDSYADRDSVKNLTTVNNGTVTLYAQWEANSYTIVFNANGGYGDIPSMQVSYDQSITLPDGAVSYRKYTLDGVNITEQVVSGAIILNDAGVVVMMLDEETGVMMTPDGATVSEDGIIRKVNSDGTTTVTYPDGSVVIEYPDGTVVPVEDEDGGENVTDGATGETGMEETGTTDSKDVETEKVDATDDFTEMNSGETASLEHNSVRIVGTAASGMGDDLTPAQEELAEDIDEEPRPNKKAYESVFMGWSLEEEKDSFIPQWTIDAPVNVSAIVDMVGVTNSNGAIITLYAIWDDCPWIVAENLYYTLTQAQSGFITQDEILSHATASDREDGSPIAAGVHDNGTSFTIPDYLSTDFTQFQHEGAITENLTVVDSAGNTYWKQIWVYVVDTTAVPVGRDEYTRFIDEYFYNQPYDFGGLEDNSVWKTDPEYRSKLLTAFDNLKNDTPVMEFVYSPEDIDAMQQYVEEHGVGNSKEPDALENFYVQFCEPNRVR